MVAAASNGSKVTSSHIKLWGLGFRVFRNFKDFVRSAGLKCQTTILVDRVCKVCVCVCARMCMQYICRSRHREREAQQDTTMKVNTETTKRQRERERATKQDKESAICIHEEGSRVGSSSRI